MDLYLVLKYYLMEDKFDVVSNIKEEKRKDIVSEFLRTQIGAGKDDSKPEKRDIYTITMNLDLSEDIFSFPKVTNDCGNKSLRDGILRRYLATC